MKNIQIIEILKEIQHPDYKKSIVELNMLKDVSVEGNKIKFTLLFFSAPSPIFAKKIKEQCTNLLKEKLDSNIQTDIIIKTRQGEVILDNPLPNVKNRVAIVSGKGGVGKSTVTANLAVALAKAGAKVGLVDADIFGPSIPKMFDVEDAKPYAENVDGKDMIVPIEKYGIKLLSVGLFVQSSNAVVWRGPLAGKALRQMILDTKWGDLDYLLFDMPPGTSDIQLSLTEILELSGTIVVTTPQDISLIDASKAIDMCKNSNLNIPIYGLIENMAWFTPDELPNNKYYIFGKDGGKRLAEETGIEMLGQIPIVQGIRENSDKGTPIVLDEKSIISEYFINLAKGIIKKNEK
jgi:ATP-binding protein involved in chromosome partitioning